MKIFAAVLVVALALPAGAFASSAAARLPDQRDPVVILSRLAALGTDVAAPDQQAPVRPAPAPAPSDQSPWLPIALSIAAGLGMVGASVTQIRRGRIRRRRPVST